MGSGEGLPDEVQCGSSEKQVAQMVRTHDQDAIYLPGLAFTACQFVSERVRLAEDTHQ
jgi:hypothetical protein